MKGLFYRAYLINRYALLLPILLYGAYYLTERLMYVNKIISTISGGSTLLTANVQKYVETISCYSAYWICKHVVKQFPCIKDVSIIRTVDQTMYCDATIKNIAYCVNNDHVLTDQKELFSSVHFDSFLIAQAKKCFINNDFLNNAIDKVSLFLNRIPEDVFSLYHLAIENEYDVRLYPIVTSEYYIKLTLETFFNQEIMHEAIAQISSIKKQYPIIYKNNQCIVIDMRFQDQIVFTKENKGIL